MSYTITTAGETIIFPDFCPSCNLSTAGEHVFGCPELHKKGEVKMTPLRAIKAKCLECSNGSKIEVKLCVIPDCALFLYRFGKNPKRAGMGPRKPKFLEKPVVE